MDKDLATACGGKNVKFLFTLSWLRMPGIGQTQNMRGASTLLGEVNHWHLNPSDGSASCMERTGVI